MIINLLLCIIIVILLLKIFKFDKYTKNDFYNDIINLCDWLIQKIDRVKKYIIFKQLQYNEKEKENEKINKETSSI